MTRVLLAAAVLAVAVATETPAPPSVPNHQPTGDASAPPAKAGEPLKPNGPLGLMVDSGRANQGGIVYVKRPGTKSDL